VDEKVRVRLVEETDGLNLIVPLLIHDNPVRPLSLCVCVCVVSHNLQEIHRPAAVTMAKLAATGMYSCYLGVGCFMRHVRDIWELQRAYVGCQYD
jgi:hypothetical protein